MIDIEINNVAIIEKAEIKLQGITVIAGLNGTGKSTIAKSVFSALNSRKKILQKIYNDQESDIQKALEVWLESESIKRDDEFLEFGDDIELAELIMEYYTRNKSANHEKLFLDVLGIIENYCKKNGIEILSVENILNNIVDILCRNLNDYITFFVEQYYHTIFSRQINSFSNSMEASIQYKKYDGENQYESRISFIENEVLGFSRSITSQLENAIYIETYSVLNFCEDIGRFRFNRRAFTRNVPTKELIEYIRQDLDKTLSFSESMELEINKQIVDDIMDHVTHGKLYMSKSGNMEFIDIKEKKKIEFSNMSAGLKIFALIQRLLENYSLKKGDVLIVDEPEVNLHPKWQIILAEIMVRIYKELGIYVLINSHSPYFIRAIEIKMAEYECADKGKFYYMNESGQQYVAQDVTQNMEVIYKALYEPLEEL